VLAAAVLHGREFLSSLDASRDARIVAEQAFAIYAAIGGAQLLVPSGNPA
jgi:hypothetical protein